MRLFFKLIRYLIFKLENGYNFLYNKIVFYREDVIVNRYRVSGRIFINNKGTIEIGNNFKANSGKNRNPIGGDTILRLLCYKNAKLIIGNNVGMSNITIVCKNSIAIGNNVLFGGSCKIWDTDFHSLDYKIRGTKEDSIKAKTSPIIIKDNAFIGGGSIILKGVTIGKRSIIAAGSVVSKSVPDGEIWGGCPIMFIKKIKE